MINVTRLRKGDILTVANSNKFRVESVRATPGMQKHWDIACSHEDSRGGFNSGHTLRCTIDGKWYGTLRELDITRVNGTKSMLIEKTTNTKLKQFMSK